MIRRLRLFSAAAAFGLLAACSSPTAPDIPNPDEEEEPGDPSQDISWAAYELDLPDIGPILA